MKMRISQNSRNRRRRKARSKNLFSISIAAAVFLASFAFGTGSLSAETDPQDASDATEITEISAAELSGTLLLGEASAEPSAEEAVNAETSALSLILAADETSSPSETEKQTEDALEPEESLGTVINDNKEISEAEAEAPSAGETSVSESFAEPDDEETESLILSEPSAETSLTEASEINAEASEALSAGEKMSSEETADASQSEELSSEEETNASQSEEKGTQQDTEVSASEKVSSEETAPVSANDSKTSEEKTVETAAETAEETTEETAAETAEESKEVSDISEQSTDRANADDRRLSRNTRGGTRQTVIEIRSEQELRNQLSNLSNDDVILKIADEITVNNQPIIVSGAVSRTIDLNGKTIRRNGNYSIFKLTEGTTLNLKDSVEADVQSVIEMQGDPYDRQATASGSNLTYYVTESEVIDPTIGRTNESLRKYTVVTKGKIDGSGFVGGETRSNALIDVDGGSTFNMLGGSLTNSHTRALWVENGTASLEGGYIYNNTSTGYGGAAFAMGDNASIYAKGTVFAANQAPNNFGGAVGLIDTAKLYIQGSSFSGNLASQRGGAIFVRDSAKVDMSSGYVTNNRAVSTNAVQGGGGISLTLNSEMELSGGYITGNLAASGGGIHVRGINPHNERHTGKAKLNITGGTIAQNVANVNEGGGVTMHFYAEGTFSAGYFSHNKTTTNKDWGGGGLFLSQHANVQLMNVLMTENHADGFGGGLAGCATGYIAVKAENGAMFDNTSSGLQSGLSGSTSEKHEDWDAWNDPNFDNSKCDDYFCAWASAVTMKMLGGGSANYEGTVDQRHIDGGHLDNIITATVRMGLSARPNAEAKTLAKNASTLYFNENTSSKHGGAVLCNGVLTIGERDADFEIPAIFSLKTNKAFDRALEVGDFKFELLQAIDNQGTLAVDANGNPIVEAESSVSLIYDNPNTGEVAFNRRLNFNEAGTYYYILREKPDPNVNDIDYDTAEYLIGIEVTVETKTLKEQLFKEFRIPQVTVQKRTDGQSAWEGVNQEDGFLLTDVNNRQEVSMFINGRQGKMAFTNEGIELPKCLFKIKKIDHENNPLSGVEFKLYRKHEEAVAGGELLADYEDYGAVFVHVATLSTAADGTAQKADLDEGSYLLLETKAKPGYSGLARGVWLTLENQNGATVISLPGNENSKVSLSAGEDEVTITNTKFYELPETGGPGTQGFTIGGLLLIIGYFVTRYMMRRKKGGV